MNLYFGLVVTMLGLLFCVYGIMNMMYGEKNKKYLMIASVGMFILIGGLSYSLYINHKWEERLMQELAERLDTNPNEIIVEELSESGLFEETKNENIRKVYFKDKTYLIEVKGFSVIKMVEQK